MKYEYPARVLREMRWHKAFRTKDLANYLGVSVSAVGMYIAGQSQPNCEHLSKMADFLGVTTDFLLGRKSETPIEEILFIAKNAPVDYRAVAEKVKEILFDEILKGAADGHAGN